MPRRAPSLAVTLVLCVGCWRHHTPLPPAPAFPHDAGHAARVDAAPSDARAADASDVPLPPVPGCDGTFESVLPAMTQAYCAAYRTCEAHGAWVHEIVAWREDPAACERDLPMESRRWRRWLATRDDPRSRRVDCEVAAECVAAIRGSCTYISGAGGMIGVALSGREGPCARMHRARVPPERGIACELDADCLDGERCEPPDGDFSLRNGCWRCVPRLPIGSVCAYGDECLAADGERPACIVDDGLFAGTPGVCGLGTVEPDAAIGEPCGLVARADLEARFADCAPNAWCRYPTNETRTGVCTANAGVGEACFLGRREGCASGLECNGTCISVHLVGEGEPCQLFGAAQCDPRAGLACAEGNRCVRVGRGEDGDPCQTDHQCAPWHVCDENVRLCVRGAAIGEPCRYHVDCAERVCTDGRCAAPACVVSP